MYSKKMGKVLIVCTGNSCRSQMAEGWFRKFAHDKFNFFSAGTHPEPVNPIAIKVMKSECINISHYQSNHINDFIKIDFDYIITVCDDAKKNCPVFLNSAKLVHKSFPDPAKAKGNKKDVLAVYVKVRDMLKSFCEEFVKTELDNL